MPRPDSPPSATESVAVRVARVGADGDGIAALADGTPLYIPFALPGETLSLRLGARRGEGRAATIEHIESASPERVAPRCRHFTQCGGCALQHWDDAALLGWKSAGLAAALARAGFPNAPLAPAIACAPATRRRMDLALAWTASRPLVGLHAARSERVIDLAECPVLDPALAALLAPLRAALAGLVTRPRAGAAVANLLDGGIDLLLRLDRPLGLADRMHLVAFARATRLVRLSLGTAGGEAEPLAVLRPPRLGFGAVTVSPPPGAFLQATASGEAAIRAAVLAGLPERLPRRARLVELFAGCGTLSFALAALAPLTAYEGDEAAAAALREAARAGGLGGRISVVVRDLARRPPLVEELRDAAAVVLDPPHAGAAAAMTAIAAAGVKRVIHVSCNPATLARDARHLAEAGYRVVRATPIDQFLWSARIESVVVFER